MDMASKVDDAMAWGRHSRSASGAEESVIVSEVYIHRSACVHQSDATMGGRGLSKSRLMDRQFTNALREVREWKPTRW